MNGWEGAFLLAVWGACGSMLRSSVRSKRSMLPQGVLLWACAYTLTRPPIYDAVDALLGGLNMTNLLYRLLMLAALGCLEVMLFRATRGIQPRLERRVAALTTAVCVTQCLLFVPGAWPRSSTYLVTSGGTWPREMFWNLLPLAVAVFAVHVVIAVGPGWRQHRVRSTRWGIGLIAASSITDLAWTAWNLASSVTRLTGQSHFALSSGGDVVGEMILGISALLTGTGVLLASSERFADQLWLRLLLIRAWPMWWHLVRTSPQLSLSRTPALALTLAPLEPEPVLYRRWVELADRERSSRSATRRQRRLLDRIEQTFGHKQEPADLFDGLLSSGR